MLLDLLNFLLRRSKRCGKALFTLSQSLIFALKFLGSAFQCLNQRRVLVLLRGQAEQRVLRQPLLVARDLGLVIGGRKLPCRLGVRVPMIPKPGFKGCKLSFKPLDLVLAESIPVFLFKLPPVMAPDGLISCPSSVTMRKV